MTFDFDNLDPYDPKFCVFKQCFPIIFQNFGALRHISAYNEIFKLNLENKDHIHTSHSPFNQSFWFQTHKFQLGFRVESRSFWVHFFTSGGASLSFSGHFRPPPPGKEF